MPENDPKTSGNKSAERNTDPLYLAKVAARVARAKGGSPEEALQRILDANADVAEHLALFRDEARAAMRDQQAGFRELQASLNAAVGEFKGSAYDELERLRRERESHSEHSREMQAAAKDLRTEGLRFFEVSISQWTQQLWAILGVGAFVVVVGFSASRYVANVIREVRAEDLQEHKALYEKLETQEKEIKAIKKRLGVQ